MILKNEPADPGRLLTQIVGFGSESGFGKLETNVRVCTGKNGKNAEICISKLKKNITHLW